MAYKHILLATDLSKDSATIAKQAQQIARSSGAHLGIMHVLEHVPANYGGGEYSIPLDLEVEATLRKNAEEELTKLGKMVDVPKERQFITVGSIKTLVTDFAKEHNIDLIVVGRHGRHGVKLLMGSSANAILHAAPCDVLAIRTEG